MGYSGFQLIGVFILLVMLIFFYRRSISEVLKTPKESLILCIPIILLGIMFYFFFKVKGF
jgi:heme/copper-type cytochrome/quinol oxidase subunit 2